MAPVYSQVAGNSFLVMIQHRYEYKTVAPGIPCTQYHIWYLTIAQYCGSFARSNAFLA